MIGVENSAPAPGPAAGPGPGGEPPVMSGRSGDHSGRGRHRPWWPIVTAILVVGVAVSVLIPAGRHQWALSIIRQPTPYTALSFDHPASLPAAAGAGQSVAFTFSIENHEGHTVHYAYVVSASPAGSSGSTAVTAATAVTSMTTVADGQTRAISVRVVPQCSGSPCRIVVTLPKQHQSIDFLVSLPKGATDG